MEPCGLESYQSAGRGRSKAPQTMEDSVQPKPCPIRQRLIAELESAHALISDLNDQDVTCILRRDLAGSSALANQLANARIRRELAIEAIRAHMDEHGC